MDKSKDDLTTLRAVYCPPLDEAVFYAIQSDYDLADPDARASFVRILNGLKTVTLEQDDTDFDPSGTGGFSRPSQDAETPDSISSPADESISNGVTSITTGMEELRWDQSTDIGVNLEKLSLQEKEEWLKAMFPDISPNEISQTLEKCDGAMNQATDHLLNISFLKNDDGVSEGMLASSMPKGVDGFASDGSERRPRKARNKKKSRTSASSRSSSTASFPSDNPTNKPNFWASTAEDVEFICARTTLPIQKVNSAYHTAGGNLPATIETLVAKETVEYRALSDVDTVLRLKISELKSEFATLPEQLLHGLLMLTGGHPSAARDLAEVMVNRTLYGSEPLGKLDNIAQYTPLQLDSDQESRNTSPVPPWNRVQVSDARIAAAENSLRARTAFSQASAAHKRGKSDRLMAQAGGYYASVGHERLKAAKELSAAAADAHVSSHSSGFVLDLHGVSVADAVRISRDRTQGWWESLGDARYASGGGGPVRAGYRIVTGVGRHSKDGTPRIGPAVSRMLVREGWKVEVGQGELTVYGKARR